MLYNPDFINNTEMAKVVLLHEALHLIFRHFNIKGLHDANLLNIALDASLNPHVLEHNPKTKDLFASVDKIKENPDKLISGITNIYEKKSWQEIYEYLLETGFNGNPNSIDDHSEMMSPSNQSSESKPGGEDSEDDGIPDDGKSGDEFRNILLDKEVEDFMNENSLYGTEAGDLLFDKMTHKTTNKEKWVRALKRSINGCMQVKEFELTYSRVNRCFRNCKFRMPTVKPIYEPTVAVVVDCSGSMGPLLEKAIDEVYTVCSHRGSLDYVVLGDVQVNGVYKNVTRPMFKSIQWAGFGGTSLKPLIECALRQKHDILVIISDMIIPSSDVKYIESISKRNFIVIGQVLSGGYSRYVKKIKGRNVITVTI